MQVSAKRIWIILALAVLALGVVAALTGYIESDTGLGPLWYFAVVAMAFPLGAVFLLIGSLLLGLVELTVLGIDTYFNPLAQVCFAWLAAFAGGLTQGALVRRWRRRSKNPLRSGDAI